MPASGMVISGITPLIRSSTPPYRPPHQNIGGAICLPRRHHYHSSRAYRSSSSASFSSSSSSSSWMADYDLYELLGVESSSTQSQIKAAYRALQKRCHPDVAGPAGHDMAVVLNEVYSLLSDPASRLAYDQEQAMVSEFGGYTGKPIYSTWHGSANEERAIFVDETKCVGCLKCALVANRTFAIESTYGRARVVRQWGDSEEAILDAIQTCPVDCICIVARSNLAALEFLMSKQPRLNVKTTGANTTGARVINVFSEVDKLQRRFSGMKRAKESEVMRETMASAVNGIRAISNWWYWQPSFIYPWVSTNNSSLDFTSTRGKYTYALPESLQDAVHRCKTEASGFDRRKKLLTDDHSREDYWSPVLFPQLSPPESNIPVISPVSPVVPRRRYSFAEAKDKNEVMERKGKTIELRVPLGMGICSAAIVGIRGDHLAGTELKEHIAGSLVLKIVNSFELQIMLAGAAWFLVGLIVASCIQAIQIWEDDVKN